MRKATGYAFAESKSTGLTTYPWTVSLFQPLKTGSFSKFLKEKGGGLHHVSFLTDDIVKEIKKIVDQGEIFVAELYNYHISARQINQKDHWVTILEYKNGYFLIADPDAPHNNIQGQFVWIHENLLQESFIRGTTIKYPIG